MNLMHACYHRGLPVYDVYIHTLFTVLVRPHRISDLSLVSLYTNKEIISFCSFFTWLIFLGNKREGEFLCVHVHSRDLGLISRPGIPPRSLKVGVSST